MELSRKEVEEYTCIIYLYILKKFSYLGYISMHELRRYMLRKYKFEDEYMFKLQSVKSFFYITKDGLVDEYAEIIDKENNITGTNFCKINENGESYLNDFLSNASMREKEILSYID